MLLLLSHNYNERDKIFAIYVTHVKSKLLCYFTVTQYIIINFGYGRNFLDHIIPTVQFYIWENSSPLRLSNLPLVSNRTRNPVTPTPSIIHKHIPTHTPPPPFPVPHWFLSKGKEITWSTKTRQKWFWNPVTDKLWLMTRTSQHLTLWVWTTA